MVRATRLPPVSPASEPATRQSSRFTGERRRRWGSERRGRQAGVTGMCRGHTFLVSPGGSGARVPWPPLPLGDPVGTTLCTPFGGRGGRAPLRCCRLTPSLPQLPSASGLRTRPPLWTDPDSHAVNNHLAFHEPCGNDDLTPLTVSLRFSHTRLWIQENGAPLGQTEDRRSDRLTAGQGDPHTHHHTSFSSLSPLNRVATPFPHCRYPGGLGLVEQERGAHSGHGSLATALRSPRS